MKEHVFEAHGEIYEIKTREDGQNKILIQAFSSKTNTPVGFCYSVSFAMDIDMKQATGISGVQSLIAIAKDDVINKQWEKLSEIMKNVPVELVRNRKTEWI